MTNDTVTTERPGIGMNLPCWMYPRVCRVLSSTKAYTDVNQHMYTRMSQLD